MRRTIVATVCILVLFSNHSRAEDLKKLVDAAIAAEVKAFDGLQERFEKGTLKPAESVLLFGKKSLTKKQKQERLQEIREQVLAGEVSFRILPIAKPSPGDCGCLPPMKYGIKFSQSAGADAFLGCYWEQGNTAETAFLDWSKPLLFRGVPGTDKLVDDDRIQITCPLLVTGRYSYNTVGAGVKTTFALEPLSVCVKAVNEAQKKSKK